MGTDPIDSESLTVIHLDTTIEYGLPLEQITDIKSLQTIAEALWALLDNIDTIDDMVKGDNELYRDMASVMALKRHQYLTSDGYNLFLPKNI